VGRYRDRAAVRQLDLYECEHPAEPTDGSVSFPSYIADTNADALPDADGVLPAEQRRDLLRAWRILPRR
jgi:hypothetical protein